MTENKMTGNKMTAKKKGNPIAPATTQTPAAKPQAAQSASIIVPPAPSTASTATDSWQQAHDALQTAFDRGNQILDQTQGAQRATLNRLLDTLSGELTALDQEDMESRTLSLQAQSQQLDTGIANLKSLRAEIAQIATTIADAAEVVTAIDGALSGLKSFLATFPAL